MLILNEQITKRSDVFSYIPREIRSRMNNVSENGLEEIRLRSGLPISLYYDTDIMYIDRNGNVIRDRKNALLATREHIAEGMELITSSSVYAVENRLQNGFITLRGGHRVGISGQCVVKDGKITFIDNVFALNYRIARQIKGVADTVINKIVNNGKIRNTLILAPPSMGKTTLLRDIARILSESNFKVSVVDERSEISGLHDGVMTYDLGPNTDVLDNSPKAEGIMMMLRSMSPDVIVTDEIGGAEDMRAVVEAAIRGVSVITTIHANSIDDVRQNSRINARLFECFITLGRKCFIKEVITV